MAGLGKIGRGNEGFESEGVGVEQCLGEAGAGFLGGASQTLFKQELVVGPVAGGAGQFERGEGWFAFAGERRRFVFGLGIGPPPDEPGGRVG